MNKKNEFTDVYPDLQPTTDKVYSLGEAASSLIPTGSSIYKAIFTDPIQNRTNTWMKEVEQRLLLLQSNKKISISDLATRPEFSALLLKIIQEVEITSQSEKLNALSNFAVNLALSPDIEIDEIYIFSEILKTLTPSHIAALHLYASPSKFNDRFKEIHQFSITENSGGFVSFNEDTAKMELAKIFCSDPSYNVTFGSYIELDEQINTEYWSLIHMQLSGFNLLILKDNNHSLPLFDDPNLRYTIYLKCRATKLALKLLQLISNPIEVD